MPIPDHDTSLGTFDRHDGLLLTIIVNGADASTTLETALPAREYFVNDFSHLTQGEVEGRFVIEAGPGVQLNRAFFLEEKDYRFAYLFIAWLVK